MKIIAVETLPIDTYLFVQVHTADAQHKHPYRPRPVQTRLHVDGSIVDQ